MSNILPTLDILIDQSGDAWIAQRKVAELCGLGKSAINDAIARKYSYAGGWILNENNQLDAKSAYDAVVHFVKEGKPVAIDTLCKIGEAGMKAFIYHLAGYQISAIEQKREVTLADTFRNMAAMHEAWLESEKFNKAKHEAMQKEIDDKASKEALAKLQRTFEGNQCPRGYLPKYKLATYFDLPVSYFTDEFLGSVQQVSYPFSSGMGGLRTAVAYRVTDVMDLLGITE